MPSSTENRPPSTDDDLAAMDVAIDRLKNILPEEPYVLTIPQDVSDKYRHSHQYQANQWLYNAPFRSREGEDMQYQTFHYHEPLRSMFMQRTHGHLESRTQEHEIPKAGTPITGANTPNGSAGPKKVLSFAAYRRNKEGTPAPENASEKKLEDQKKQAAVKGPVERLKAETEEVLAAAKDAEDEEGPIDRNAEKEPQKVERSELKRKRESEELGIAIRPDNANEKEEPAPKKIRQPPLQPPETRPEAQRSPLLEKQKFAEQQDSPRKRSEGSTLPPRLSPLRIDGLPSRLSPTLPANIKATLMEHKRSSSDELSAPNSASKDKTLTPTKNVSDARKHVSPVPRNGFRASSNSPAVQAVQVPKPPLQRAKSPALSREDEKEIGLGTKGRHPGKRALIVKLKYKKTQRDAIRRLLNMPRTRRKPTREEAEQDQTKAAEARTAKLAEKERRIIEGRQVGVKGVAQKIGPATPAASKMKPGEERARTSDGKAKASDAAQATNWKKGTNENEESVPAQKKKNVPDALELKNEPSTPAQQDLLSPVAPSTAHRSAQATPSVRKDVLSASIQRDRYSESVINTPSVRSNTPITHSSQSQQANGRHRAHSSPPSDKTPLQQAWEKEQGRLQRLGRELKHVAQNHVRTHQDSSSSSAKAPNSPSKEQTLAAVAAVECYLTFMLTFVCADEASEAADPRLPPVYQNWQTLEQFFSFVKGICKAVPSLEAVVLQLGVSSLARMLEIAGIVNETRGPKREELLGIQRRMLGVAADAEARLDVDALQDAFPKSWQSRDKGRLPADNIRPAHFAGAYKLPIGVQTSPLRAARAGHRMLLEWIEKEKLDYSIRLKF